MSATKAPPATTAIPGTTDPATARAPSPAPAAPELLATVIIPVRDGGPMLQSAIEALAAQSLDRSRFEVLIADDGSSDGAAARLATEDGWVRVLRGPPVNSYAARNRAAGSARGAVLAFCDADCRPHPTWLEEGLRALEDADVVAGTIRLIPPERPTVWTLLSIDMFLDQERAVGHGNAMTANLFVSRETFAALDGFDETIPSGGDFDFARRCVESGRRLALAPRAVVNHPSTDRGRSLLSKTWRVNTCVGIRRGRSGDRPTVMSVWAFVPFVGVALARREVGRPLRLDARRLGAAGLRRRLRYDLRALPMLYLVIPYVAGVAHLNGWCRGTVQRRRDRRGRVHAAAPVR